MLCSGEERGLHLRPLPGAPALRAGRKAAELRAFLAPRSSHQVPLDQGPLLCLPLGQGTEVPEQVGVWCDRLLMGSSSCSPPTPTLLSPAHSCQAEPSERPPALAGGLPSARGKTTHLSMACGASGYSSPAPPAHPTPSVLLRGKAVDPSLNNSLAILHLHAIVAAGL